jgi:geranylgeranyl diphosphate synthase, type II
LRKKVKPLQAYLAEVGARIEERLDDLVPLENVPYRQLFEGARYTLLADDQRLCPIIALAVAETLGCDSEVALNPACALEMVQTYAFIHEDLPALENHELRRGKVPLHAVIPEGQTILTGSFLLTSAFSVLCAAPELTSEQRLGLVRILSSRAGGHGLIGGQVLDMLAEGEKIELDTLETLHALKNGALLTASFEFGGVLGEADEDTMLLLQTIGEALGLAFQIMDELVGSRHHSKSLVKVDEEGVDPVKATYVSMLGIDRARETAATLQLTAHDAIEALPGDPTLLLQLAELFTSCQD